MESFPQIVCVPPIQQAKYKFAFKQSAKGFWYVDDLQVSGDKYDDVLAELKKGVNDLTVMLQEMNKGKQD